MRIITKLYLFLGLIAIFPLISIATAYGALYELIDQDGITHRITTSFQRIISLYPAHTENLTEMGAASVLIGISTSDDYPASILHKPRYSYHDSIEKFISARPDCILIRPMIRRSAAQLVEKLQKYGITVISLQPRTTDELYKYWRDLGVISGYEKGASKMIASFNHSLQLIIDQVNEVPVAERPFVYFESIHARMKTFSPASITMFCLETAGGINVASDALPRKNSNIAAYSKERILAKSSEIDVFLAQSGRMNRVTRSQIINEPGFGAIKAVQNNRVYLVEEHFVSRPTTRLLTGIKHINNLLYNEHDS